MPTRKRQEPPAAGQTLAAAVRGALDAAPATPADAGAVRLALSLAEAIDSARDDAERVAVLDRLAPKLLAALEALGCTVKARAAVVKGGVTGGGRLEQLRAARASRAG